MVHPHACTHSYSNHCSCLQHRILPRLRIAPFKCPSGVLIGVIIARGGAPCVFPSSPLRPACRTVSVSAQSSATALAASQGPLQARAWPSQPPKARDPSARPLQAASSLSHLPGPSLETGAPPQPRLLRTPCQMALFPMACMLCRAARQAPPQALWTRCRRGGGLSFSTWARGPRTAVRSCASIAAGARLRRLGTSGCRTLGGTRTPGPSQTSAVCRWTCFGSRRLRSWCACAADTRRYSCVAAVLPWVCMCADVALKAMSRVFYLQAGSCIASPWSTLSLAGCCLG